MISIKDCLELFLADLTRKLRPNSVSAYRSDLNLAASYFSTRPLDQFKKADLQPFLTQPNLAPSTLNRRTTSLSRFFQWAVTREFCSSHPLEHFELSPSFRKLPRPIHS